MAPLEEFRRFCTPPQRERVLFTLDLAEFASVLQSLVASSFERLTRGFVLLEGLAQ